MYTRCPSCSCTFRVTATILQMAEGDVRCGSCGAVFNALQTLVDDWTDVEGTLPGAPKLGHPDLAPQPPPAPPAATPDRTLEFDVPETEWQRFFITPQPPAPAARLEPELGTGLEEPAAPAEPGPGPAAADAPDADGPDADPGPAPRRTLEEETADTDTWKGFLREAGEMGPDEGLEDAADAAPAFVVEGDRADEADPGAAWPDGAADDVEPAAADAGPADEEGGETAAPLRPAAADTVLDWGPPPAFPGRAPRPPAHPGRWLAASVVAAIALGAQFVHYSRDALAADPSWGAVTRAAYARIGVPLNPGWPLEAYEIRGAKAIAGNTSRGALDVVAEIAVTGDRPVGAPLVRIVLRDRWSNAVASGVFDAATYLTEAPPATGVYPPGSLIPVAISLADPGSAAQGYELDVCLPNRHIGLQCRAARDPFRR